MEFQVQQSQFKFRICNVDQNYDFKRSNAAAEFTKTLIWAWNGHAEGPPLFNTALLT